MRLVIAGASGFVARELVPLLSTRVDEIVLVGRDSAALSDLFPGQMCVDYEKLENTISNFDMMLCLVTKNNNQPGNLEQFRSVNVEKVKELALLAERAGVDKFVHFSTFHAVYGANKISHYARTKVEAERILPTAVKNTSIINLRLPAIYGDNLNGKLRLISKLPRRGRNIFLRYVGALQPVVSVECIANEIISYRTRAVDGIHYLSTSLESKGAYVFMKRTFDLLGAVAIVLLFGWMFPLIWIAVKFDSKGPGVFLQERVGINKKPFYCYKFRTMLVGTQQLGTHEVSSDAVTRVGSWLRATKLDELPQVINVFRNEMSLVGPRPCLFVQEELIKHRTEDNVFEVKPGITGLGQIRGLDMSGPKILSVIDREYIETRSMVMDVKILVATLLGRGIDNALVEPINSQEQSHDGVRD